MSINRSNEYIISLMQELLKQPNETQWLEFKHNNYDKEMIGEYISALSNSAALHGKINLLHRCFMKSINITQKDSTSLVLKALYNENLLDCCLISRDLK